MVKTESLSTDSSDRTVDVGTRCYYSKTVSLGIFETYVFFFKFYATRKINEKIKLFVNT